MDGLNHSVITGECSGCVAYREKVARLEAANAALTAALRGQGCHAPEDCPGQPRHPMYPKCVKCVAALSDIGEGSPEVK